MPMLLPYSWRPFCASRPPLSSSRVGDFSASRLGDRIWRVILVGFVEEAMKDEDEEDPPLSAPLSLELAGRDADALLTGEGGGGIF